LAYDAICSSAARLLYPKQLTIIHYPMLIQIEPRPQQSPKSSPSTRLSSPNKLHNSPQLRRTNPRTQPRKCIRAMPSTRENPNICTFIAHMPVPVRCIHHLRLRLLLRCHGRRERVMASWRWKRVRRAGHGGDRHRNAASCCGWVGWLACCCGGGVCGGDFRGVGVGSRGCHVV